MLPQPEIPEGALVLEGFEAEAYRPFRVLLALLV